jgi:hypothetical protein
MSYGLDKAYAEQSQTLRQRLEERKKAAEEHLADVTQALEFLDKNPNFESFHNLIGKAGF